MSPRPTDYMVSLVTRDDNGDFQDSQNQNQTKPRKNRPKSDSKLAPWEQCNLANKQIIHLGLWKYLC